MPLGDPHPRRQRPLATVSDEPTSQHQPWINIPLLAKPETAEQPKQLRLFEKSDANVAEAKMPSVTTALDGLFDGSHADAAEVLAADVR